MGRKSKQAELDKIRNRNKAKIAESKAATTTLRGQTAASGRKRDAMKMSKASDLEGARKKGAKAANKFRSARAKAPISSGAPKAKAKKSTTPPLLKKPSVGVLKPKAAPKLPFSASVKGTGVKKKPNPRAGGPQGKADALRKQIATLKQRSAQSGAGAAAQRKIQSLQNQLAALTGK